MRIKESLIFPDVPITEDEELKKYSDFLDELITLIGEFYRELSLLLNGEVNLTDNLRGDFISKADSGTANTEFSISHNLKQVPEGYMVVKNSNGGVIYDGSTAWTSTTIYLKCTTANNNIKVYVF